MISGRGARGAGPELIALLDRLGAVYLDTGESRGLVPDCHPSVVGAMRGAVMGDADVVLTVGRRLDFQLAYGSPAVFGGAQVRAHRATCPAELRDNRRGAVEILASPGRKPCARSSSAAGNRAPAVDRAWAAKLRAGTRSARAKLPPVDGGRANGSDGRLHPNRVLAALQEAIGPDAIVVTDGGDFLSFARVGLSAPAMLDPGPFGCIGIGVPYGIAASLAFPDRPVVVATGDGAFGFNAIEIDTAVRHKAPVLIVVANNGAWQIEVHDQTVTHGKVRRHAAAVRRPRGDGARLRHACRARRDARSSSGRRSSGRSPTARRCSTWWSRRRRCRPTRRPGWPGCPTCSRWPPGTRPSGNGAAAGRPAQVRARAPSFLLVPQSRAGATSDSPWRRSASSSICPSGPTTPICAKATASASRTVMRRLSEASAMVAPPVQDFDGAFQTMVVSEASRSPATVASEDPDRQPCGERRPELLAATDTGEPMKRPS